MSTLTPPGWEAPLLALAAQAHRPSACPIDLAPSQGPLRAGYTQCEIITAAHSRSFSFATALLPAAKRRAVRALYAICRISDDLADSGNVSAAEAALDAWRRRVLSHRPPDCPVLAAFTEVRRRYALPQRYLEQLFDAVAQDLRRPALVTFDDLAAYAYGVASTVGLMSLYIIGCAGREAMPYAIKLGVALQLTNILRDVGEDARAGRVYLPAADLAGFGLTAADLTNGRVDERWRALMRFEIHRARRLYAEARPGIGLLHPDGRLAVAAAAEVYRAILADIEAHDYDVFSRRAHVSRAGMLALLPAIGWRSRG